MGKILCETCLKADVCRDKVRLEELMKVLRVAKITEISCKAYVPIVKKKGK